MKKLMQIKKYLPEIAFVALMGKVMFTSAGLPESLALISLVVSISYTKWLNKYKDERYERLEKLSNSRQLAIEEKFASMRDAYEDRIKTVENRVSSLFMEKGVKAVSNEQTAVGEPGNQYPGLQSKPKKYF